MANRRPVGGWPASCLALVSIGDEEGVVTSLVIDYQPIQVGSVASMDRRELVTNIVAVARTAKLFGVPVVLSTVNVKTGANQPTIHQLADVLDGRKPASASPRSTRSETVMRSTPSSTRWAAHPPRHIEQRSTG